MDQGPTGWIRAPQDGSGPRRMEQDPAGGTRSRGTNQGPRDRAAPAGPNRTRLDDPGSYKTDQGLAGGIRAPEDASGLAGQSRANQEHAIRIRVLRDVSGPAVRNRKPARRIKSPRDESGTSRGPRDEIGSHRTNEGSVERIRALWGGSEPCRTKQGPRDRFGSCVTDQGLT